MKLKQVYFCVYLEFTTILVIRPFVALIHGEACYDKLK